MTLPRLIPLVAAACALAVPASAGAAFPGKNGPLLYDHDGSLFEAPAATLSAGGYDWGAAASPDGSMVAYAVNHDIFVMNADGSGKRALTTDGLSNSDPAWSPDGRQIAYVGAPAGNADLYVVPAAGGKPKPLTTTPDHAEGNPAWSPDGTQIAYERSGCDVSYGGGSCVFVMPASGGTGVNLTPEDSMPGCESQPGYHFDGSTKEPDWSPDGTRIVFSGPLLCEVSAIGSDVWVMNADGAGKTDLTADDATNDRQPVFSPDGTSIAFMSDRGGSQRIWTMGASGGGLTPATAGGPLSARPNWAPAPKACVVPKLAKDSKATARTSLERMGCALGKVSRKAAKGKAGRVIAQGKPAGKRLPLGAKVAVTLSR